MDPSMAIVNAGPINEKILSKDRLGNENDGNPCGIPPKAVPIVCTLGN